jgi:2',3'-cyclic-nucleotide 2'-phosphodiesterase (5'-nucleotidase family)
MAEHILMEKRRCEPALYFDTGDCIKSGNLAIPLRQEPAWDLLHFAGCDASVLGNRETHVLQSAFQAKIAGHKQPMLCANLRLKSGKRPLAESLIFERAGLKIGVFGIMVPMVTDRMKTQAASAYLWDPPLETARRIVGALIGEVDLVIALTHIGHKKDLELAEFCPEIDVILGGHSHTILEEPLKVNKTWICQGGSHGRYIGRYEWENGVLSGGLLAMDRL